MLSFDEGAALDGVILLFSLLRAVFRWLDWLQIQMTLLVVPHLVASTI
jgi:hypothetical protein